MGDLKPFGTQIDDDLHRRITIVAAQDRLLIRDIVEEALKLWLSQRKAKKGEKR